MKKKKNKDNSKIINKCVVIILKECLNYDIKDIRKIIRDFNYQSCKAANKGMAMKYFHELDMMNRKNEDKNFDRKVYEVATYGKQYGSVIADEMKVIFPEANTMNISTLRQQLVDGNWNTNAKDILSCKANIPNYKITTPYYIHNKNYKLRNNGGWFVDLAFFSITGQAKYGFKKGHKFEFKIDKLDNSKKTILTRIINGEYKQGSAQISLTDKGKIKLAISFSFDRKDTPPLNKDKILGVDLGITNIATMSIFDVSKEDWDYLRYNDRILSGKEVIAYRQKCYNLRRQLSISTKVAGKGRIGHGRKCRMKPLERIRNKEHNFADLYNHKVSKYIVELAEKNECATIQMEDLSKATKDINEMFLKSWSYYDLQQKIIYKAKEKGINVIKVNPKYTSKRCSKCGCIHEDNRDCKNNQAKFECKICGYKENADINASKNISIPHIDTIIDNTEILSNN